MNPFILNQDQMTPTPQRRFRPMAKRTRNPPCSQQNKQRLNQPSNQGIPPGKIPAQPQTSTSPFKQLWQQQLNGVKLTSTAPPRTPIHKPNGSLKLAIPNPFGTARKVDVQVRGFVGGMPQTLSALINSAYKYMVDAKSEVVMNVPPLSSAALVSSAEIYMIDMDGEAVMSPPPPAR
jgi:hypothetical protein